MISSRTEKERLRALIGLDGPDNLAQTFKENQFSATTDKVDLPHSTELISLLQKQDQIINELYGQLDLCKQEIYDLKDRNVLQTQENQIVFEELRAQILKQNLSKALNQSAAVAISSSVSPNNVIVESSPSKFEQSKFCSNCEILQDSIKIAEREKHNLHTQLKRTMKEVTNLKEKEKEHLQKIRQAVHLADDTILEKAEITMKWKIAEQSATDLAEEIKTRLIEHQKSLHDCKQLAFDQYNTELQRIKSQLLNVSEKESAVSQENEDLKKSVKSLQEDLEELRSRSKSSEHDYENKLSANENVLTETSKEKDRLDKELKELQQKFKLESQSSKQKIAQLEQSLSDQSMQLQSSQSTLKVIKKDDMELRERCEMLEKEISNLRSSKRRLETDKEIIAQRSAVELKESLRMAELKQEQTKSELEQLINTQNSLISKLREECKLITEKTARLMKEQKREIKALKKERLTVQDSDSISIP